MHPCCYPELFPEQQLHLLINKLLEDRHHKNEVTVQEIILDNDKDASSHFVIKSGTWFSMKSQGNYSLIGCTVAPPFDYNDFELAPKEWKPGKF